MNWTNEITKKLNIQYPIIQAPMLGVATPEMVAATNEVNCLGALPVGNLSADDCITIIRKTKKLTNKHFAVNFFANEIPEMSETLKGDFLKTKQYLEQLASQNGLEVIFPDIDQIKFNKYQDQVDAIISENCKIVSFTFGNLDAPTIQKLKANDVILIGTCTSVSEAIILEKSGIDIICVQGIEAGGHRGSFEKGTLPAIGGLSLLSRVRDSVKVPLIYAGGIYDGKTLLASKIMGASGFQIGSLLLGSVESLLQEFEKDRLRNIKESEIVLTNSFSGRYARGIKNKFVEAFENTALILPYPYQNKLTAELRKKAKEAKNLDLVSIWLGQSINEFSGRSTSEIIRKLIESTEESFDKE